MLCYLGGSFTFSKFCFLIVLKSDGPHKSSTIPSRISMVIVESCYNSCLVTKREECMKKNYSMFSYIVGDVNYW